ncbi:small, acid-soluble spore protein, alpha/beta type [Gracilibacillus salitolerans]|uniref:Small, acid-soluble spore protein, alpha/beta type n=1 Tax=Gracilibacillus salitolerans TaxID=2663022 RepID=A0A5Q2TG17_9BACI|nr:alpha/beta-type small acid-soluble spore protein [Gracilibacillus salitolerans]QGH33596.1 small, acid-soluble spore protein, alpha/beta type [Gracilibacillus salitolerans]
MVNKNKILVPEAREGLDQLKAKIANTNDPQKAKYEVAAEQQVSLNKGYNGNIKAKDAGKIGGHIGGNMVQELVKMGQQQLHQNRNDSK